MTVTNSDDSWNTVLHVDLMYFTAARRCFDAAKNSLPEAEQASSKHKELWDRSEEVLRRHGHDPDKAAEELEPLSIGLTNQGFVVSQAYGPVLENVALVHLLSAGCLEAHVNKKAQQYLPGRMLEDFGKMTVTGKWLFLPQILKGVGFTTGAEPFQTLDALIKWRNLLAHYKGKKEVWTLQNPVPSFLESMGLTVPQAERSLRGTRRLVEALSGYLGEAFPVGLWDGERAWPYFGLSEPVFYQDVVDET